MDTQFYGLTILAAVSLAFPIYFLPAYIAAKRQHPDRKKLLLWNLLTGWTLVGWIAVFILAVQKKES
ncbi:MAG: superinfection immunity protein [Clostridia bacterium]|nr:superinfection immunity protein [Clostridia bacterium]